MLAGNLVLFALILFHLLRSPLAVPVAAHGTAWGPGGVDGQGVTTAVPGPNVLVITNEVRWAQLESEDYPTYIARLRAAGCPEQTVRDIIIADLDKVLAPEIQSAQGRRKELAYWHSEEEEVANDVDRREVMRREREIARRKQQIIRELLNIDLARERMQLNGREDYLERRLSFLPGERRSEVRDVLERYDTAEQQLRERELEEGEVPSQEERTRLRQMREQREAELGRLLSPTERQQFDLWLSPTANAVRHSLYGMQASEAEFLAVYQARKAFEDRWQGREADLVNPATQAEQEQERAQMETRLRQELGEQRYAEYKRGEDEDYHRLHALATRFKLPKDKAAEAYAYKQVALSYRARVLGDTQLEGRQRQDALQAINEETEKALRELLGDRAYRYLIRSGQGGWVRE